MEGPEFTDVTHSSMLECLHPFMVTYGILPKKSNPQAIQDNELHMLAHKLKVKVPKDKKKESMLKALYTYCEQTETKTDLRKYGANTIGNVSVASGTEHIYYEPEKKPAVNPLSVNYFGLPIHALSQTASGLVYRGRKPVSFLVEEEDELNASRRIEKLNISLENENDVSEKHAKKDNFVAQRKVASALLAIACNPATVTHFVLQGGMDAIFKLSFESSDQDTLVVCSKCLSQAALTPQNRKVMLDKQVLVVITHLIENGGEQSRRWCAQCLCRLSTENGLEDLLLSEYQTSFDELLIHHVIRRRSHACCANPFEYGRARNDILLNSQSHECRSRAHWG